MTESTKEQDVDEALAETLRVTTALTLIGHIRSGQKAGIKWAAAEISRLVEMVRVKLHAERRALEEGFDRDFDLDDLENSTLSHSFRYISGDIITETMGRLLGRDPADERDRSACWGRIPAELNGEAAAWFALGFIQAAAEVIRDGQDKLSL